MKVFFALLAACCLSSCSFTDNRPSLARQEFERRIPLESGGAISVIGFAKTDGVEGELAGVKTYEMKFDLLIRYEQACYKVDQKFVDGVWMYGNFKVFHEPLRDVYFLPKGTKVHIYGTAHYEKHEGGWVLNYVKTQSSHAVQEGES